MLEVEEIRRLIDGLRRDRRADPYRGRAEYVSSAPRCSSAWCHAVSGSDLAGVAAVLNGREAQARGDAWIDAFKPVRKVHLSVPMDNGLSADYTLQILGDPPARLNAPDASLVVPLVQIPSLLKVVPSSLPPVSGVTC